MVFFGGLIVYVFCIIQVFILIYKKEFKLVNVFLGGLLSVLLLHLSNVILWNKGFDWSFGSYLEFIVAMCFFPFFLYLITNAIREKLVLEIRKIFLMSIITSVTLGLIFVLYHYGIISNLLYKILYEIISVSF